MFWNSFNNLFSNMFSMNFPFMGVQSYPPVVNPFSSVNPYANLNSVFSFTPSVPVSPSQSFDNVFRYVDSGPSLSSFVMPSNAPKTDSLPEKKDEKPKKSVTQRIKDSAHKAKSVVKRSAQRVYSAVSGAVKSAAKSVSSGVSSILSTARRYLGYNEENDSYKLFTHGRDEAWCADYVSYVARQSGAQNFDFSSVQQIWDWGGANNRFSKTPKVGDAVIFKGVDANGKRVSHTGYVTDIRNGKLYTIEGNTSDKVAERSYDLNDSRITGYVTIA